MSMELAAFLKPGLSAVSGSPGIARRLVAAGVALGVAVPAVLAFTAAAPAFAAARQAPAVQSAEPQERAQSVSPGAEVRMAADFRVEVAPLVGAAVRHGIDPEAFVTAVTLFHTLKDQELDPDRVSLAPGPGRRDAPLRLSDKDAGRWIEMLRAHGREAGAGKALDMLDAALSLEGGKRNQPLVRETVRRMVAMWDDAELEAEVMAREVLAVQAKVVKDAPLDAGQTYLFLAFGVPKVTRLATALATDIPHGRGQARPKGGEAHAFRVLDASTETNALFLQDLGNGRVKALNSAEFLAKVGEAVSALRDPVRKAIEANTASLEGEGPSGSTFG